MIKKRVLVALGALTTALAACSSEIDSSDDPMPMPGPAGTPTTPGTTPTSTPTTGPTATTGPTGTTPGTPTSVPTNAPPDTPTCVPGIPATSQIPRILNRHYDAIIKDVLGVTLVAPDSKPASELLLADESGAMTPEAWRIYQDVAAKVAKTVMAGDKTKYISCDPAAAGCMDQTIAAVGRKLFRRPLTEAEVARFKKLGETTPKGTPAEVAEATLQAFLMSPSFLLAPEIGTTQDPSGAIQLTSYEVATKLAFTLWGSGPDAALDAAADANMLQTPAQIMEQAQRMIAVREKTGPLVAAFHNEWAQTTNNAAHWWKMDHDKAIYPLYDAAKKESWKAELNAFFEEVAFSGGSFKDLLLSNVAFVNKDNAEIYGLPAANYTAELKKEMLDANQRPGFLTRVGFLSSYAGFNATSPILRGAYISVWMLGVNPGAPLPGATMKTVDGVFPTQRSYVEALTKPAECSGCHNIINQPGFVLESFDALGKIQTKDPRGGDITAAVTTAKVDFGGGVQKDIATPLDLMKQMAEMPKARQIYSTAWVAYAFGRNPNSNDQCVANQLDANLAKPDYTILKLLGDLTQADSFRLRVRQTP